MRRALAGLLAVVALAAAAVATGRLATAEEVSDTGSVVLDDDRGTSWRGRGISYRVVWGPPPRGGGWSFACVDVTNGHVDPHRVHLSVSRGELVRAHRSVRLEPGASTRVWLPWVRPQDSTFRVKVESGQGTSDWVDASGGFVYSAAVVRTRGDAKEVAAARLREAAVETGLQRAFGVTSGPPGHVRASVRGSSLVAFRDLDPACLPPSWTHLTGASLVVVEGAARGLDDPERQATLGRYLRAGGLVLVVDRSSLPKGPLADLLAAPDAPAVGSAPSSGAAGLGRWIAVEGGEVTDDAADLVAQALAVRDASGTNRPSESVHVLPPTFAAAETIPGLARVDTRLYLVLLLVFAVLVGPVAYVVLKRRRRLVALVAVIPATGFGFAAAILGYGLLSEGFRTRGVVTSVSFLDQRDHEAVCIAGRTLYSGWSPGALRPSPDTVLQPREDPSPWSMVPGPAPEGFDFDVDAGRVSGSALPSRTVTPFATASRARARERLRFRRRAEGGYDVLTAEGFGPVAAEDGRTAILLRDAAGAYHASAGGAAPLLPIDAAQAERVVGAFRVAADDVLPVGEEEEDPTPYGYLRHYRYGYSSTLTSVTFADDAPAPQRAAWVGRVLSADGLRPSTYLAWTTRAPGFDDLGLEVTWERRWHLTIGVLAPEDLDG